MTGAGLNSCRKRLRKKSRWYLMNRFELWKKIRKKENAHPFG